MYSVSVTQKNLGEINWGFSTNSAFLIPIFLQPGGVNLGYFKFGLLDLREFIVCNLRSTKSGCKDIKIRKSKFAAKTQFL